MLGLPNGVDPLTFNPYADGVDSTDALAVEKVSQQIMSVVSAFSGAGEGAGATEAQAFEAALSSVVEVVKAKAAVLNDQSAAISDKILDLTSTSDLALVKDQVSAKLTSGTNVQVNAFNALANDTVTAVKNVNSKIAAVSDLASESTKMVFSTTQVLENQVKDAAKSEAQSSGSGSIDFADVAEVDAAVKNKAPTDISLSSSEIREDAISLLIGHFTTADSDQSVGVGFKYKIAELSGTDYDAFSINKNTGELYFKAQPDFETKSAYNITILSTDEGGKTLSKNFKISVLNVRDSPSDALAQLQIKYVDERLYDQYTNNVETLDTEGQNLFDSVSKHLRDFSSYADVHQSNALLRVTSEGFTVDYGEYEFVASFANFSPQSLLELQKLQNIDAADKSTWIINGGFSNVVIRNTSGDLVKLTLDSLGLTITSETVSTGDLSGLRLDGTFNNQLSDILSLVDYYSKVAATDGTTAAAHLDNLRAYANGKFELTGISLLREGSSEAVASVGYHGDNISFSVGKFDLTATIQKLNDLIKLPSLDLVNVDLVNGGDVFGALSNTSTFNSDTEASLVLNHADHGILLNLRIEDIKDLENVSQGGTNIIGMINGDHYAVDENFVVATYFDFGDKVLDTSTFETYFYNIDDLSDVYLEIL